MNYFIDIKEKVKKAMLQACNDVLEFTDKADKKINAEYLFTVNVAKSVKELNSQPGDPYKIYLEKNTKHFAKDCLKPYIPGSPLVKGSSTFLKSTPKIDRNGRIDVAIYADIPDDGYFGEQPLCAIELKGFSPKRNLVISDLKRNLEYFRVSGNTGDSVLNFALFASFIKYKKFENDDRISSNEIKAKSLYQNYLSELGNIDDIDVIIETFTVRKDTTGKVYDYLEYSEIDTKSKHHFIGIMICFKRK